MSWGNYIKTIKVKDFNLKNLKGLFVITNITNTSTMELYEINAVKQLNLILDLKTYNQYAIDNNLTTNFTITLNHFDRASHFVLIENKNILKDIPTTKCLEMDLDLSPNRQIISLDKNQNNPQIKTIPAVSYFYSKQELIKIIPEIIEWKRNHSKNEKTFNDWIKKFNKLLTKYKLEKYEQRIIQEVEYS